MSDTSLQITSMSAENECPACGAHKAADDQYCVACRNHVDNLRRQRAIQAEKEQSRRRTAYFLGEI